MAELLKVGRSVFEAVAGRPMTAEDLNAAFAHADEADVDWQAALAAARSAAARAAAGKEDAGNG